MTKVEVEERFKNARAFIKNERSIFHKAICKIRPRAIWRAIDKEDYEKAHERYTCALIIWKQEKEFYNSETNLKIKLF